MFSHDPDSGVYNGIAPCWNNQSTIAQLRCPARLSQTRTSRSGGKGSRGSCPSHVAHRVASGRPASPPAQRATSRESGSVPLASTGAGRHSRYSSPRCPAPLPWRDGRASAVSRCQRAHTRAVVAADRPPVANAHPDRAPSDTAPPHPGTTGEYPPLPPTDMPTRSAPFFLGPGIDHRDDATLTHPLRRPGRTPGPRALIRTARILQDAPNRAHPHPYHPITTQSPLQHAE